MDSINTLDPQPNILVGLTVEQLLNVSLRQEYTLEIFRSLNETALQAQTLCCFTKQGDPWVLLSIQKYFLYLTYTVHCSDTNWQEFVNCELQYALKSYAGEFILIEMCRQLLRKFLNYQLFL